MEPEINPQTEAHQRQPVLYVNTLPAYCFPTPEELDESQRRQFQRFDLIDKEIDNLPWDYRWFVRHHNSFRAMVWDGIRYLINSPRSYVSFDTMHQYAQCKVDYTTPRDQSPFPEFTGTCCEACPLTKTCDVLKALEARVKEEQKAKEKKPLWGF